MIVDLNMQRRENLADDLEQRFEIFVAPSNERAFALVGLFQVNFVLLHMDTGNDQTAATSPALAFLREMKRSCFRTPVAALVASSINTDHEAQKLLARALQQGGICCYFEEGVSPDTMARLKLGKDELALRSLTQAIALDPQNEKFLHNRGLMYRRMGLFVQTQTEYTKRDVASASATTSAASVHHRNTHTTRGKLGKCEMEDGLFAHLFGKPTLDKLALACPATERSSEMLDAIVARLQTLLFFQDFPREILLQVAQQMDYDVVACGKSFVLGETHPQNFYVLLGGRLSVRRRVGTTDFASLVTTHHLSAGTIFGCAGFAVSSQASLIAGGVGWDLSAVV